MVVNLPGFSTELVALYGGITTLCGPNSSGKSRLMRAISAALAGDQDSGVELVLRSDNTNVRVPNDGPSPHDVVVIEPFYLCQKQRLSILIDANLPDRIEQVEPYELKASELRLVRYLMGRDYEFIRVRELEETDESSILSLDHLQYRGLDALQEIIPYFEVGYRGVTYNSLELSQGELAGLSLFWALKRCQHHQFVLIEEPESFLSPQSAQRSLEVVAHFAGERKFACVVSTHSYLGLAGAPEAHTLLLEPVNGITQFVPATQGSIWRALHISSPKTLVLAVEDEAASQWLRHLLVKAEFPRVDESQILVVGGSGHVRRAAEFPRAPGETFVTYGVLDGDEREVPIQGRALYLPGDKSIEATILEVLTGQVPDAGALPWPAADVQYAIDQTEGLEPHERVDVIAGHLGQHVSTLRHLVLEAWSESNVGQAALATFVEDLELLQSPQMDA
jgi:predicted ATPase